MKTKKMHLLTTIVSMTMIQASLALGNDKIGNGGDIVNCQNKPPVVLDYYEASLKKLGAEAPIIMNVQKMNSDEVIEKVMTKLEPFFDFYSELKEAVETVGNINDWIESESAVVELSDSKEAYTLPPSCKLIQAAVRQDSTVYVSPEVMKLLSPGQVGVLSLHESIYFLGTKRGHTNSVKARGMLAYLLKENTNPGKLKELIDDFSSKGIPNQISCRAEDYLNAAADGNLTYIKYCLKEGLYIDFRGPVDKKTALGLAVENNNTEIAKFLLAQGANPNLNVNLKIPVRNFNRELTKALIDSGLNDSTGALGEAISMRSNFEYIKFLTEVGIKIDDYAFKNAIDIDQLDLIKLFIDKNAIPSTSVLEHTIQSSLRIDILEAIINANKSNLKVRQLLYHALEKESSNGKFPFSKLLIEKGLRPGPEEIWDSIRLIPDSASDVFEFIVQNTDKSVINEKFKNKTLLYIAVEKQDLGKSKILLKYGALPNLTSTDDLETPLYHVAKYTYQNSEKFIDLFMSYNADINLANRFGTTPIMISVVKKMDKDKTYEHLMKYNPNLNLLDHNKKNVLFYVGYNNSASADASTETAELSVEKFKYFIQRGANPLQVDSNSETINREYMHRILRKYFNKLKIPST